MMALGGRARAAAAALARAPATARSAALAGAARAIRAGADGILAANERDLAAAPDLPPAQRDRLALDETRLAAMADAVAAIAELPDPLGRELAAWTRPNGLHIARVSVPLGVLGIIYEARPNVTADAAALALRAGNAVILRGGSEAAHSNRAIAACWPAALAAAGLPPEAVQMVPGQDRALVGEMLAMAGLIDVIVPRGGKGLIARVRAQARVPVFAHLDGNNHVYVHRAAGFAMARDVVLNAKLRRVSVCGAAETLLIDRAWPHAAALLAALADAGCEIRGDEGVRALEPRAIPASDADWDTEYLAAIIAARLVSGPDEAMAHIARHGSGHTDAIITDDAGVAEAFVAGLDSAILLVNASTQFADGGEFGFGAEIGIATGRLHARGPVGAAELTTYKNILRGQGQVRP